MGIIGNFFGLILNGGYLTAKKVSQGASDARYNERRERHPTRLHARSCTTYYATTTSKKRCLLSLSTSVPFKGIEKGELSNV